MKNKNAIRTVFTLIFIISVSNNSLIACQGNLKNSSDSLKNIRSYLAPVVVQTFQELKVPGAIVGVFIGGYEPYTETLGIQNLETSQPFRLFEKMRIGSVTKTFTGTVLLQLVDEGKISLSDKLSDYFPDYPNADNITIQDLGDMRSGIYNYSENETFQSNLMKNLKKPYTPEELIAISEKHVPYFTPGSSIHYSNTNTIFLGLIIEKLTGNTLQKEIEKRILVPLGMNESNFAIDASFPDPHAHGYMYMESNAAEPTDVTDQNPSWGWSAGAMISTLADLTKYAKPLATGQLISKSSQEARMDWKTDTEVNAGVWKGKNLKYGFAVSSYDGAIGHNGGIPGFNSFMGYLPEKDATIIVLVNMQDNKAGTGPADFIAMKIIELLKAK